MKRLNQLDTADRLVRSFPMELAKATFSEVDHTIKLTRDGGGCQVEIVRIDKFPSFGAQMPVPDVVAVFALSPIRGNTSVVVTHGAELADKFRGKGLGVKLHVLRLEWMKAYGASVAICTVLIGNQPMERILEKYGWTLAQTSKNPETGHRFGLYIKPMVALD